MKLRASVTAVLVTVGAAVAMAACRSTTTVSSTGSGPTAASSSGSVTGTVHVFAAASICAFSKPFAGSPGTMYHGACAASVAAIAFS